jgi:hypothetical protein
MSQQPEPTLPFRDPNPAPAPGAASGSAPELRPPQPAPRPTPQRIPPWLENSELFLRVLLRMYFGLLMIYAPWSGQIAANFPQVLNYFPWSRVLWDQNPLFMEFPTLGLFAANGVVRGLVSGLGLLNLWFAFHAALRRRDG